MALHVLDEWDRWQQGGCLEYAVALIRVNPALSFGSLYRVDGNHSLATHHFAHDDTFAYDSAGQHTLPYLGIYNQVDDAGLNEDANWYEEPDEGEVLAALDHIYRNNILPRKNYMAHNETITNPKGTIMAQIETPDTKSDYFEIRINKRLVKKVVATVTVTTAIVGAVFVARNLSVENTEESVTVELDKP